jgi:methylenetetrahydrofolate dehydrogenase (NADP+)/methenyltetrahydrofolate cyclohydrolase
MMAFLCYPNHMRIDGRQIAARIYEDLRERVNELKKMGITPRLTVVLIGDDPASVSYVSQKKKWGEYVGAKIVVLNYPTSVTVEELQEKIYELNNDLSNHATLIQRPVPSHIDIKKFELMVSPRKDIDGFHPDSPYTFPLALAVAKILEEIHALPSQFIVTIGKGPTGGGPIIKYLRNLGYSPTLIDSKTENPDEVIGQADIVISAVGSPNIITARNIKRGVSLIGVGIARGSNGKLHGDYDEESIKDIAAYYTPTPGGVGPVNVAMLLWNLVKATEEQVG